MLRVEELNAEADAKANLARTSGKCWWLCAPSPERFRYPRVYFDGSFKDGECGAGFVVYASQRPGVNDDCWCRLAWFSVPIHAYSITGAELEAAAAAQAFAVAYLDKPVGANNFLEKYDPWSFADVHGQ